MRKLFLAILLTLIPFASAQADIVLSGFSPVNVEFSGFTAPTAWSNDGGTDGALDWNTWAFSTGTRTQVAAGFGATFGSGRGTSAGGVSTNGVYAFEVATGINALGFQATGGFGSPGSFTTSILNDTGKTLSSVAVAYTAWYYNDAPRSGVLRPYYSLTNDGTAGSYLTIDPSDSSLFDIESPDTADANPAWVSNDRSFTISGLSLADGDRLYFRFGFNDSGSGTRDEWAISSLNVTAVPEPSSMAVLALAGVGGIAARRARKKVAPTAAI